MYVNVADAKVVSSNSFKAQVVSWSMKRYQYCSVLVGSWY